MNASQIQVGHQYEVQAGRNKTKVKIVSFDEEKASWKCETPNGKILSIKDTERFLSETGAKKSLREIIDPHEDAGPRLPSATNGPLDVVPLVDTNVQRKRVSTPSESSIRLHGRCPLGEMSGLAAAHRVLREAGKPLTVREIMEAALANGYCKVSGKTPFNTFNGGIRKEITKKGGFSRFVWVGKGLFAAR